MSERLGRVIEQLNGFKLRDGLSSCHDPVGTPATEVIDVDSDNDADESPQQAMISPSTCAPAQRFISEGKACPENSAGTKVEQNPKAPENPYVLPDHATCL